MTDTWLNAALLVLGAAVFTVIVIEFPPLAVALRWLRYWLWRRPRARLLATKIWVDCSHGDDDAPGTRTAPIRTLAELHHRTRGQVYDGDIEVFLTGDFEEALRLETETARGAIVHVQGVAGSRSGRRRLFWRRLSYRILPRRVTRWWFERQMWRRSRAERGRYFRDNATVGGLDVDVNTDLTAIQFVNFRKEKEK